MSLEKLDPNEPLKVGPGIRHYIVFQIKLLVDAFRDLAFGPISIIALMIDAFTKPTVKESLSYQLMLAGRKSDRVINLFEEYTHSADYTIDETVKEVESALIEHMNKNATKTSKK